MATDNETVVAAVDDNNWNKSFTTRITEINEQADLLNVLLNSTGKAGGTVDSATNIAVTALKVQSAAIKVRIDVLFPETSF